MVMQTQKTSSSGKTLLIMGRHTGQDTIQHRSLRKCRPEVLHNRRCLRRVNLEHQSELDSAFSIDIDTELLTGNLDHDITLLA